MPETFAQLDESFSWPWTRKWDGHRVVDSADGRLALRCAEDGLADVGAAAVVRLIVER